MRDFKVACSIETACVACGKLLGLAWCWGQGLPTPFNPGRYLDVGNICSATKFGTEVAIGWTQLQGLCGIRQGTNSPVGA